MEKHFMHLERNWEQDRLSIVDTLQLQFAASKERLSRLTDAYLSGDLDKELFQERKTALLMERRGIEDKLASCQKKDYSIPKQVREFLELAKTALNTYENAPFEERRHLLEKITSNRVSDCETVEITLAFPFSEIANRFENQHGGPSRNTARTWDDLLTRISAILPTSTKFNRAAL